MSDLRLALGVDSTTSAAAARVTEALDEIRVVVRVGAGLDSKAAVAAAALVSMVARLHAHVDVDGNALCGPNPWGAASVGDVLDRVVAHRPVAVGEPRRDLIVAVGNAPGDICIGGGDWSVIVGPSPVAAVAGRTGLGLHAAAAFGAAEAFKRALGPLGMAAVDCNFAWDLLTYTYSNSAPPDARRASEPVLFAGAGSVNSSAAAQLMGADLGGEAIVVDHDAFDPARNPYRYPAASSDTEGPKAMWVRDILRAGGWNATATVSELAAWVTAQAEPGFPGLVVSSVDTVNGRADVADVLARTTLSAGVHGLRLHIQREHCFDDFACPNCDFVDLGAPLTQVQAVADATGLSLPRVADLLREGELSAQDVAAVVAAGHLPHETAVRLVGHRIQDLIGRLYAEASITVSGQTQPVTVSAPFVSWMTGALLAAEVVKSTLDVGMVDRRVELDLAGVPSGAVGRRNRDSTGRCTCHSPWRRRAAAHMAVRSGSAARVGRRQTRRILLPVQAPDRQGVSAGAG